MAKSGRQLTLSAVSTGSYVRFSKAVAVATARWPPAEKPTMPIRSGAMPHSFALPRTRLTARWASWSGRRAGSPFGSSGRRGTRYFRMTPVTPSELSQAATSSPSSSQYRFQYPPPGQMMTAAPVSFSFAGR